MQLLCHISYFIETYKRLFNVIHIDVCVSVCVPTVMIRVCESACVQMNICMCA